MIICTNPEFCCNKSFNHVNPFTLPSLRWTSLLGVRRELTHVFFFFLRSISCAPRLPYACHCSQEKRNKKSFLQVQARIVVARSVQFLYQLFTALVQLNQKPPIYFLKTSKDNQVLRNVMVNFKADEYVKRLTFFYKSPVSPTEKTTLSHKA